MTSTTRWLPRVLRWIFRFFTIAMAVAAFAIVVVMVIDPKLPSGTNWKPMAVQIFGQPGFVTIQSSTLTANYLTHDGVNLQVSDVTGLVELVKHTGLPIALLSVLYFGLLFDLLRRLFRNVERGESFTRQTVRLVQIVGVSLLAYSVISAFAEGWFEYVLFDYLSHHAVVTVSGTAVHLPRPDSFSFSMGSGSPFGSSYFFSGLLVLALSEVFRQGLALKSDHDLTI